MDKNKAKTALIKTKNHIVKHKVSYVLAGVSLALLHGNVRTSREIDKFLIEKGLNPLEFWLTTEDFESLTS